MAVANTPGVESQNGPSAVCQRTREVRIEKGRPACFSGRGENDTGRFISCHSWFVENSPDLFARHFETDRSLCCSVTYERPPRMTKNPPPSNSTIATINNILFFRDDEVMLNRFSRSQE